MSRSAKQRIPATTDGAVPASAQARRRDTFSLVSTFNVSPVKHTAKAFVCSRCSSVLRPIKTEWYEWLLTLSFLPFQCHWCGSRAWRIRVRRRPFVWLDPIMDTSAILISNRILRAILVIVLTGAAGALLGYLVSKVIIPKSVL